MNRIAAPLIGVALASGAVVAACGDGGAPSMATDPASMDTSVVPSTQPVDPSTSAPVVAEVAEPALRDELLAMLEEDQAEMTGEVGTNNSSARTDRLVEIFDEYGWPTFDLVGEEASTAAWAIAQHADLDPEVQVRALELLRPAAEAGQASLGDLAYLTDRVAVSQGDDQFYGTQIGCGEDGGVPTPATPIADEAGVDARRAEAGLAPLEDYLDEMAAICAGG